MAGHRLTFTALAITISTTIPVSAQTIAESGTHSADPAHTPGANVVSQAEDAFGFRAGPEESGLYDAGDVRGFDPVAAGNIRVQGLYADLQGVPSDRLSPQSAVRVGSATAGSLLSAPTGLVDYSLAATDAPAWRLRLARESFGFLVGEIDALWRDRGGRWSLNAGAALSAGGDDFRGTRPTNTAAALVARWQPISGFRVTAFHDATRVQRRVEPFYYPAGDVSPPRVQRGAFLGQPWSDYRYTLRHSGVLAEVTRSRGPFLKAGAFRSSNDVAVDTYDLFEMVGSDGVGRRTAYLFPPQRYRSTSGEAQLGIRWGHRIRQQAVVALRVRRVDAQYGGELALNLGEQSIFEAGQAARPTYPSSEPQTGDRTRQSTWIAGYRLQNERFDIDASVARTNYRKTVALPGELERDNHSRPWLYSGVVGWRPNLATIIYASGSQGLEASGVAPTAATNRNEILPAIVTRQREIGVRRTFGPLRVAASVFRITKPYASLNDQGLFALNGTVRHDGIEASATGAVRPGVDLLAGLVLLRARASGPLVEAGEVSARPIGVPSAGAQFGINVSPQTLPRHSFDLVLDYRGRRVADLDGSLTLPGYVQADVGMRYRILAGERLVLRAQIVNLFNAYAFTVAKDGAFFYSPGRSLRLSVTVQAGAPGK